MRPVLGAVSLTALALAASPAPAAAATVRGYVPGSSKSFDYSFTTRTPAGIRVAVRRADGHLDFRRGDRTLVRARMCAQSVDDDARGALTAEAEEDNATLRRIAAGVYRVGSEYWIGVRGGSCLRFARRPAGTAVLTRILASRTTALLGRRAKNPTSDAAGLALARRTDRAAAALERAEVTGTGGVCSGAGLSCPTVRRPGSIGLEGAFDVPARYSYARITYPGLPADTAIVTRGSSQWIRTGDGGCWSGPIPAGADALDTSDFGLSAGSWRMRFAKPRAQADGTTRVAFSGYWRRGIAIVDGQGRVTAVDLIERDEPNLTTSTHLVVTYPAAIAHVATTPACRPSL